MNIRYITVAPLILIVLLGALAYGMTKRAPAAVPLGAKPAELTAYWASRIHAVGGEKAYQEFGAAVAALSPSLQHQNAHSFGGALFEALGVDGLSVCDAQYSYGCYHQFLGSAIATLGLGVVDQLNQACVDHLKSSALSCQHGIGHGIQAFLGYDDAALRKSLAMCAGLPYNDPIGGCYGGVFMEYNMQTMLGDQARIRPAKNGDLLDPCDSLDSAYQRACYFWAPQWWLQLQHQAHGKDVVDTQEVGELCDRSGSGENTRSCYEGLGTNVVQEANFDPARAAAFCEEASTNTLHQVYCKSYAANSLTDGGAGKKVDGAAVCKGLTGTYLTYCEAYASNKANLAAQLPDL